MDLRSSRSRDPLNLIESDDERKPSMSSARTSPAPPNGSLPSSQSNMPKLPPHLQALLDEWHSENGNKAPICAIQSARATNPSQVFDKEGNKLKLDIIEVKHPTRYKVLVLYPLHGSARLAKPFFPHGTGSGTFLHCWLGVKDGLEADCCAVRQFAKGTGDIVYNSECWSHLEELKLKDQTPKTTAASRPVPQPRVRPRLRKERGVSGKQIPKTPQTTTGNTRATSESDSSDGSSSETDTSSESEEEEVPSRPTKRIKQENSDPSNSLYPDIVFKLISFKSGAIRRFPLRECRTGKMLFEKARFFYKLFDKNVEVKVLSCQISSEREQHYLFEGSEGEFNLLIDHVKAMDLKPDDPLTIEIGHVVEQ